MSQSAKGTFDKPGKNVWQKSGLNRRILDQGWGLFRIMLEYKSVWFGTKLIKVPPAYTSQTCPQCSYVSQSNRVLQAKFQCVSCDFKQNADYVGALNILERKMRLLACEETMHVDRLMKQEPTEAYL